MTYRVTFHRPDLYLLTSFIVSLTCHDNSISVTNNSIWTIFVSLLLWMAVSKTYFNLSQIDNIVSATIIFYKIWNANTSKWNQRRLLGQIIKRKQWQHLQGVPQSNEPRHKKTCFFPYANNKGTDQPTHPRSLISAFVVRCQDSMVPLRAVAEISSP